MLSRHASLLALVFCLAAPPALAQGGLDDMLTPLTSPQPKAKASKSRKPARDTKSKKPARAPEPPSPMSLGSDLVAPLVSKTELLVKVGGGVRGARLFVDDKDLGPAARGPFELEPGEHAVLVRRPGYRDVSRRVTLKEGERTELAVSLEATGGFVTVKADIVGARVLVDGEERGRTPLDELVLSAGSHEIVVRQDGFRPESQRITVRAGKEYTVNVNLRPGALAASDAPRAPDLTPAAVAPPSPIASTKAEVSPGKPITQRWYFWAGVGAVVAAAAVGTVVATSQSLNPNEVCGGVCDGVINQPKGGFPF